jgi:TonB family protein
MQIRRLACVVLMFLSIGLRAQNQPSPEIVPAVPAKWTDYSGPVGMPGTGYESGNRAHILELEDEERRLGTDNPALVPAVMHLGDWYFDTRQDDLAIPVYRRAVTLMEKASGSDALGLVGPLGAIADSYEREERFSAEGLAARERVVHLYEAAPGSDVTAHADALLALGDWHLMAGHSADAVYIYVKTWQWLNADRDSAALAKEKLSQPQCLRYRPPVPVVGKTDMEVPLGSRLPPTPRSLSSAQLSTGFVLIEFTVTEDGSITDARIEATTLPSQLAREVRVAMSQALFRPAFVNGRAVSIEAHWRQSYVPREHADDGSASAHRGPSRPIPLPSYRAERSPFPSVP